MCNISFSSRTLVNKVSKEISFTTTSNLKKHQSITSKVSAKGNDSNRTDKGEYLQKAVRCSGAAPDFSYQGSKSGSASC